MVVMAWSAVRDGHRTETWMAHSDYCLQNTCPSHTGDLPSSMVSSLIPNRFRIQEFQAFRIIAETLKLGPELNRGKQGMFKTNKQ